MPKNLSLPQSASTIEEFYTAIHARMALHESRNDARPTIREFVETLSRFSIGPGGQALDAGCGGTAAVAIACAGHGFRRVQAIDINQDSLRRAKSLIGPGDGGIRLSCGSVLALPFPNSTFDFAACVGVAHHTPDPERAIAELARVVRPQGRLYFSVYCFSGSWFERAVRSLRYLGRRVPFGWMHRAAGKSQVMNNFVLDHMYVPTLWVFRAEEVRALLARHGFSVLEEWVSRMDPFARHGWIGRQISGDGLMRVWLCERSEPR
jgi:SAM-dependent methyltransferase